MANNRRALNSNQVRWDDIRVLSVATIFPGSADPALGDWKPGGVDDVNFPIYVFAVDDYITATCQMPHNYKEGTDLYFHIHWTPRDKGTTESGNKVGWKVDYTIANMGSAFGASATVDLSDACTGTNHLHEVTSSVSVSGAGLKISHMIMLKIYRSDTGTDDTWAGTLATALPAILEFDIHYQIDDFGSADELIK